MRKYFNEITQVGGGVVTVRAQGVAYEELGVVVSRQGSSLAQVIELKGDLVSLQVFQGTRGLSSSDRIRFLGHPMRIPAGESLLGRVFDGAGRPRDGRPMAEGKLIELGSAPLNPVCRRMPDKMVQTGIPMIDVFNSLVESQKLPIFSIAGEPYNELLARIGLQADADIIVLGGISLRHDDYLNLRNAFVAGGAWAKTIMFLHTAADPVVEALMVPDLCLAVAESFAVQGRRVLVLLTDMTAFADALKEIAIIMGRVPSNRGYPGDLYTQLARRYEKACDIDGAGSVTVLACTTVPGDDITHPVPDNTGYITEGQFYLRGGRIDPFESLSRLKQFVNGKSRDDHRALMDNLIQLYADCRQSREKREMGFDLSAWDEKLLGYGKEFEDRIMDLSVNIRLCDALDLCWKIIANHFSPEETGIRRDLIDKYWPISKSEHSPAVEQRASVRE